jgi:hypothetical protein
VLSSNYSISSFSGISFRKSSIFPGPLCASFIIGSDKLSVGPRAKEAA